MRLSIKSNTTKLLFFLSLLGTTHGANGDFLDPIPLSPKCAGYIVNIDDSLTFSQQIRLFMGAELKIENKTQLKKELLEDWAGLAFLENFIKVNSYYNPKKTPNTFTAIYNNLRSPSVNFFDLEPSTDQVLMLHEILLRFGGKKSLQDEKSIEIYKYVAERCLSYISRHAKTQEDLLALETFPVLPGFDLEKRRSSFLEEARLRLTQIEDSSNTPSKTAKPGPSN